MSPKLFHGVQKNQEKLLSRFRDISEKDVFLLVKRDESLVIIYHPSSIHPSFKIKNSEDQQTTITNSKLKSKIISTARYKTERDQIVTS